MPEKARIACDTSVKLGSSGSAPPNMRCLGFRGLGFRSNWEENGHEHKKIRSRGDWDVLVDLRWLRQRCHRGGVSAGRYWIGRRIPGVQIVPYIVAQVIGAVAGGGALFLIGE